MVLSGAADDTATTAGGGQYAFAELEAGDYRLAISGFDTAELQLRPRPRRPPLRWRGGESLVVNFDGHHQPVRQHRRLPVHRRKPEERPLRVRPRRTCWRTQGFPLHAAGSGRDRHPARHAPTPTGRYALHRARGRRLPRGARPDSRRPIDALGAEGYAYGGAPTGMAVTVSGGRSGRGPPAGRHHAPDDHREGGAGGGGPDRPRGRGGREIGLYPTSADADAETGALASAVTDSTGTASFTFPRTARERPDRVHPRRGPCRTRTSP